MVVAGVPLAWRLLAANAVVLVCATVALVVTPATVSDPVAAGELGLLCVGVLLSLALNVVLTRRLLAPLGRLAGFAGRVDPLRPGARFEAGRRADGEVRQLAAAINDMLGRLESERRESARRTSEAQEHERLRISRELHDQVGQVLTAVVLELDVVSRRCDGEDRALVAQVREDVRASLQDVREIARGLRPEALDDLGLRAAIDALASDLTRSSPLAVQLRLAATLPDLSSATELAVYRVAQEALTNVVRHSGAQVATVALSDGEEVTLSIVDDGTGIPPGAVAGAGIRGMRERAILVGGHLDIGPAPDGGTMVVLRVPRR